MAAVTYELLQNGRGNSVLEGGASEVLNCCRNVGVHWGCIGGAFGCIWVHLGVHGGASAGPVHLHDGGVRRRCAGGGEV
jgi:hypothetical protein